MADPPRNTANDGLTLEERIEALVKAGVRLELENQALEAELEAVVRASLRGRDEGVKDDAVRAAFDRVAARLSSPPDVGRLQ